MNSLIISKVKDVIINQSKTSRDAMVALDIELLSGIFAHMTSQYELKIFLWFIELNNLWIPSDLKINSEKRLLVIDQYKIYDVKTSMIFDVEKFMYIIGKTDKLSKLDAVDKLLENRGNTFINKIITWANENNKADLRWFQKVRAYRNELIHNVDSLEGQPFDFIQLSPFKETKTLFDANLIIDFACEFTYGDFLNSAKEVSLETGSDIEIFFEQNKLLKFILANSILFASGLKLVDKTKRPVVSIASLLDASNKYSL